MNDCLIDVIYKEAVLKNQARLEEAHIKSIPYVLTLFNVVTGVTTGHACMLFQYNNDTWNYDPCYGSVKVFPNTITEDIRKVSEKIYKDKPEFLIQHIVPIDICTHFKEDAKLIDHNFNILNENEVNRNT